ncbi:MAG: hybrid sensor histidine kinase/response regulator, partial [Treponema sp.]|nr:hybrid sensor histidine kinase/response regulator [Treponema sp.]
MDKLVQEKEIAEKARNAQSKFLANVSHEIRTPIQTIIGTCELLSETKLDREQTEYCRQIKFSSEILLSLVNDVLDYAKIEAGKMELEKNEINLEDLIEQVVDMIAIEAHQKGLGIASSIPPEATIIFEGDLIRLRQVILNLVKNAVKFTNEGTVIVKVELTQTSKHEILNIFIIDTGIGINEEIQSHIFNRFAQFDAQGSARSVGTGLGLTISLDLVKLMNGTIEVSPNP